MNLLLVGMVIAVFVFLPVIKTSIAAFWLTTVLCSRVCKERSMEGEKDGKGVRLLQTL